VTAQMNYPASPPRSNKIIAAVAVLVLIIVTAAFAVVGATKKTTYKASAVLNSTIDNAGTSLTSELNVLLPAISVAVTSDKSKADIVTAVPAAAKVHWTIGSSYSPGTGLTTISITAPNAGLARDLANAAANTAISSSLAINADSTTQAVKAASNGKSQQSRTLLTNLAAGFAIGLVLMLLILFIAPRMRRRPVLSEEEIDRSNAMAPYPTEEPFFPQAPELQPRR
jgi:capsular polysaccharide biosynthesis protein